MEHQDVRVEMEDTQPAQQVASQDTDPQIETEPSPESSSDSETPTENTELTLEDLEPGMELRGRVRNIVDFGAFVDIGVGRDGLAHISTLRRAGIDKSIQVGDELDVVVRRVKKDDNRISLTIPDAMAANRTPLEEIAAGSTLKGRIVRIVDFGAFVDIGAQTDGLVHISEFCNGFVENPQEAVNVGQEVEVRVLEVDLDRRRVSLEADGIIGWTVRQSFFQRRAGVATIVAATPAGTGSYEVVDIPVDQAWALVEAVTPGGGDVWINRGPAS